jgi:formate dehydrogenase major subunit
VPGLGTSFGRGGATTAQQDLQNADAILIMGSSMAENHPVGFQWVMKARERGATVIHVDPRFTRTSAMADRWVPLRAGSDIIFLGAMIRWVIENGREFRDYVVPYTNAAAIIDEDVQDTEDLAGLFSGWDEEKQMYHEGHWTYEGAEPTEWAQDVPDPEAGGYSKDRGGQAQTIVEVERDETLQHPRCVWQLMRKHFQRYTPELVEQECGIPQEVFLDVAEAFCSASGPDRTGAICYSVGWTQHSKGPQIIRAAAILQLILGNIGRPGGGILALRGHASIQGSTDIPTLYDILPGYLPMPVFGRDSDSLRDYIERHDSDRGWWANFGKYIVSLLKAYYGDAAIRDNEFGFDWLPRVTGDHSHLGYWLDMADGKLEGLFVIGQNPAVGAPNSRLERKALAKLKWLVVRDLVEIETASFWYDSPEVERGELVTGEIGTEVFLMPAAGHAEKEGTFTNTQRLLQWREKAVEPPGDARSEAWFIVHLGRRLKEKAARDRRAMNEGLNALWWDYETEGPHAEPKMEEILKEINGWTIADHKLVGGFKELKDDGSTACGCWIYSGVFPEEGKNRARIREPEGPYGHGWGFAWPADRRILYNRASARPDGAPWSERKKLIWWDGEKGKWVGRDVPDFSEEKAPSYEPPEGAEGDDALAGDQPFIMHDDGVGWLWVPTGLKDGPLPTHYEPLESPVSNALYPERPTNPPAMKKERPDNAWADAGDPDYPFVLTTYRITEHHTAGGMSRPLAHLSELQPELFCELSHELAREKDVDHGGWVTIRTPRGEIEARALVTGRLMPLTIRGRTVHQVGLPYHWGSQGKVRGDVVNDLVAISQEPNVRIMETKALVCNLEPGRRRRAGVGDERETREGEGEPNRWR